MIKELYLIMQFPEHNFRAREKLNLGYGKNERNQLNNVSATLSNRICKGDNQSHFWRGGTDGRKIETLATSG